MKRWIALLLTLALAVSLCACGSASEQITEAAKSAEQAETQAAPAPASEEQTDLPPQDTPAQETTAPVIGTVSPDSELVGVYKMVSMEGGDGEDSEDTMGMLESMGIQYYLVLEADGTGYMDILGEHSLLKWDNEKFYLMMDEDDDNPEPVDYSYENGELRMFDEEEGAFMIFTRLTEEELRDYEENGPGSLEDLFTDDGSFPQGEVSREMPQADMDEFHVAFVGAEKVKDQDGADAVRFYYDFTNNSSALACPGSSVFLRAGQDGEKVDRTWVYGDGSVIEDDYEYLDIAPGKTLRCTALFVYDSGDGPLGVQMTPLFGDDALMWYVDPANLPGPPADPFVMEPDPSMPDFAKTLSDSNGRLKILRFEMAKDYNDADCVRIYYEFTNDTQEATSPFMASTVSVLQDGYGVDTTIVLDDVPESENRFKDVEPGETVVWSECYELRSDSPLLAVLRDDDSREYMAMFIQW